MVLREEDGHASLLLSQRGVVVDQIHAERKERILLPAAHEGLPRRPRVVAVERRQVELRRCQPESVGATRRRDDVGRGDRWPPVREMGRQRGSRGKIYAVPVGDEWPVEPSMS